MPKPLIPVLTKPMTPPWVLAIVLASQFAFSQLGNEPKPSCTLKFERIHYSTSVKNTSGTDAVKLNVKSVCNLPQKYTELTASMDVFNDGQPSHFYTSSSATEPTGKKRNEAVFLDFWKSCKKGETLILKGNAHGTVYLQNEKRVSVNGSTGEFSPVRCDSQAK